MKKIIYALLALSVLSACSPKNEQNKNFETKIEALTTFQDTSTALADFGNPVTASTTRIFTFKNTGDTAGAGTATLTGANAASFSIVLQTGCATVNVGLTCTVRVNFNPAGKAVGSYTANLNIGGTPLKTLTATVAAATTGGSTTGGSTGGTTGGTTSGGSGTIEASISGVVISNPLDYGSFSGTQSSTKIIRLKNTGTASTGPHTAALSDTDFSFTLNGCNNKTLAPNAYCDVRVTFNASGKTAQDYLTDLTFGTSTFPLKATVAGAGTTTGGSTTGGSTGGTTSGGAAVISFLDGTTSISSPYSIGSTTTTSITKIITIKNTGTVSTGPHTAALSDTDITFTLNSCSSKTLAPNGSCTVRVTFNPTSKAPGEHGSTLTFGTGSIDLTATKSGAGAITYTSIYSAYSGCTVTQACQGNGIESRTLTACEQYTDGVLTNPTAPLSSCSTTALTRSCQSPPGDVIVTTGLPTGYDSRSVTCAAGQTVAQGTITDVTCSTTHFKTGTTCSPNVITYTAEYSDYGTCSVTQACEGVGTQSRTFTCRQYTNGVAGSLVDNSNCTPTALTQSCDSPPGTTTVTTGLPTGYDSQTVSCSAGQSTAQGTITDVTCSSNYTEQSLTCVENVVTYTLDVGGPANGTIIVDATGTTNDFTCGSGCASVTKTLNANDVVTLTFIPDSFYAFDSWTQTVCSNNPCVVTMDGNKLVGTALATPITPSNLSITINSGETTTTISSAILTLSADSATEMYVTKDSSCSIGGTWETYSTTKNVVLSINTLNTFYVKFKNPAAESNCISSQILHDNQGPQNISVTHSSSPINQTNQENTDLIVNCGDASHFMYSQANQELSPPTGSSDARWVSCITSLPVTLSLEQSNEFKFYFKDNVGNISSLINFTLIHNSALYTLSISKTATDNIIRINGQEVCQNNISCEVSYPANTSLSVVAEDTPGYGFVYWGTCPQPNVMLYDRNCDFKITNNETLIAQYLNSPASNVYPYAPQEVNPWNIFLTSTEAGNSGPTYVSYLGKMLQFTSSKNVNSLQVLEGSADVSQCNNAPGGIFSGCTITLQSLGTLRIKAIINGTPNEEKEISITVRDANEFGISGIADLGKILFSNGDKNIEIRSIELNDDDRIVVFARMSNFFNVSYRLSENANGRDTFNSSELGVSAQVQFSPNGQYYLPAVTDPSLKIGNHIYMAYTHTMTGNRQAVGMYRFNANTGIYDTAWGNVTTNQSNKTVRLYKHYSSTTVHEQAYSILPTPDGKILVIARVYDTAIGSNLNTILIYKIEPSTGALISSYANTLDSTSNVETQSVTSGVKTIIPKLDGVLSSTTNDYYGYGQDDLGNLYLAFGVRVNDEPLFNGQLLWDYKKLVILKFNSSGNLVSSYGGNNTGAWVENGNYSGVQYRPVDFDPSFGNNIVLNSSGELFYSGFELPLSSLEYSGGSVTIHEGIRKIQKLNSSGEVDLSFGTDGKVIIENNVITNLIDTGTGIAYWGRSYNYSPTWSLQNFNLKHKLFKVSYSGVPDNSYGANSEFIGVNPGSFGSSININLISFNETIMGAGNIAYSLFYGKIVKFDVTTGNVISNNPNLDLAADCSGDYPGQINSDTGLCECTDSSNDQLTVTYEGRCSTKVKNGCFVYDPMMGASNFTFGQYSYYSNTCDCSQNTGPQDYPFNYQNYSCDNQIFANNCQFSGGVWNGSSCDCQDGFFDQYDTTDPTGGTYDSSVFYCRPKPSMVNCLESGGYYSNSSCSCGNGTYLDSMTYKCLPEPGYDNCFSVGGTWNPGMPGQPGFCNCPNTYQWDSGTNTCQIIPEQACTQMGPNNGYGTWTGTYCICSGAYTWNSITSTCDYDPTGVDCSSSGGIWDGVMGTCTCNTMGTVNSNNMCICDESMGYYGPTASQCSYYSESLTCTGQGGTWQQSGSTCDCGVGRVWQGTCNCDVYNGYAFNSTTGQCEFDAAVYACEHIINGVDVTTDPNLSWQTGDWMGNVSSEGGSCNCYHDPYTLFDSNLGCNNF